MVCAARPDLEADVALEFVKEHDPKVTRISICAHPCIDAYGKHAHARVISSRARGALGCHSPSEARDGRTMCTGAIRDEHGRDS